MEYDEADQALPRAHGLRQQRGHAASSCARSRSAATRPWSDGPRWNGSPLDGARPGHGRPRPAPGDPPPDDGWRSVLAAPMLRGDLIVGVLVIRRRTPGHVLRRHASTCWRRSPASPRWPSSTPASSGELATKTAGARGGEPAQVGVPGEHVPRAAHPAERGDRLLRGAARPDVRRPQRPPGGVPPATSGARDATCWSCSTRSSTSPRSRPARWTWSPPCSRSRGASTTRCRWCASGPRPHGITLHLDVGDGVGLIEADELRFKQVLLNLLTNAVKFTPDGGSVTLARRVGPTDLLAMTVTDTGIGVPPGGPRAHLRVVPAGRPRRTGGGGHRPRAHPVPAHRRAVRRSAVARDRGRRRRQHVRVHDPGRRGRDVVPGDAPATGAVILVVDDDRASLDLMSAYLSGFTDRILRARDGVEALEQCRELQPRRRRPRHPPAQAWTGGRCSRSSRPIRPPAGSRSSSPRSSTSGRGGWPSAPRTTCIKPVRRDQLVESLRRVDALAADEPGAGAS